MKAGRILGIRNQRKGSALIVTMGVVLLIAMLAATMVGLGRQQVYSARRLRDLAKAQMLAESGANEAYSIIKTNFGGASNASLFPLTSFDGGTYDATVSIVSTNRASISCLGIFETGRATVKLDVRNYPLAVTNNSSGIVNPFGFAVLAGGYIDWRGNENLQTSNSWMHCNDRYYANGANHLYANVSSHVAIEMVGGALIDGIGRAPAISSGGTVTAPQTNAVPLVGIPDIDLTPYYNVALANGQVYSSGYALSGTVAPPGGVLWVNGDLSFANGNYTGCFIATGDVEIKTTGNGAVNLYRTQNYPVLVSRDGSILVKQAKTFTFNGLIYCKTGSFDKQGNGDVYGTGSLIAAGNVTKNGGWSGMIYGDSTPVPPGGLAVSSADRVVITAWQE